MVLLDLQTANNINKWNQVQEELSNDASPAVAPSALVTYLSWLRSSRDLDCPGSYVLRPVYAGNTLEGHRLIDPGRSRGQIGNNFAPR